MTAQIPFEQAGRIPAAGDNVAIAVRRFEAGTRIVCPNQSFTLPHTVLEGHRFAIRPIAPGEALLSWGLPFGLAVLPIAPGDYVCNEKILTALKQRHVDFALPDSPNFKEHLVRYELDERNFKPGLQVPRYAEDRCFSGFARGGNRGVGTRNFIAILGTTSLTASFARSLAERFKDVPSRYPNIDGVVAVTHTEGGGHSKPNNLDFILRTLCGFVAHPNIAAVLAVDFGTEVVTNAMLQSYLAENNYPPDDLRYRFWSVKGNYQPALNEGEALVRSWLDPVNTCQRTPQSLAHLKIGLQCGGSDAFSGVSGNPLVGWVAKELVRYGGSANLAETDELIGAESYVLRNVRDLQTARAFLKQIERFQERVGWHGHTAEGNPSGGNNFRGLYNIAIKSIGAARKKDPDVRLDYVINYGQLMQPPGFFFMDSPGNDLESVAGQVAAGCNLILFTTGNGSITNFPFVPTIKVMTNTGRFKMLTQEMDVNAGRYLDGEPMDALGRETFELTLKIASGQRSVGEKAGHSQVQLWREWRQTNRSRLKQILDSPAPEGEPLPVKWSPSSSARLKVYQTERGRASDQIGLIVPTSLCAGQIARLIADKLNEARRAYGPSASQRLNRFVALAHTEGCGVSDGESEQLYLRTMVGHLCHPLVNCGLLLEHGCEKTHNDAMRNFLDEHGIDRSRFGWASVQLDGGLESVTAKVTRWFAEALKAESPPAITETGLDALRLGLTAIGPVPSAVARGFARVAKSVVNAGGLIVVPQNSALLASADFVNDLLVSRPQGPSLAYGQPANKNGFHIMETPTDHAIETLTGQAATGVEVMLAHVSDRPLQSHPMVPLIQVGSRPPQTSGQTTDRDTGDLDLLLDPESNTPELLAEELLKLTVRVASREYAPKLFAQGNTDFQMTRGWLGVSM